LVSCNSSTCHDRLTKNINIRQHGHTVDKTQTTHLSSAIISWSPQHNAVTIIRSLHFSMKNVIWLPWLVPLLHTHTHTHLPNTGRWKWFSNIKGEWSKYHYVRTMQFETSLLATPRSCWNVRHNKEKKQVFLLVEERVDMAWHTVFNYLPLKKCLTFPYCMK
jgi:hypothetical protein